MSLRKSLCREGTRIQLPGSKTEMDQRLNSKWGWNFMDSKEFHQCKSKMEGLGTGKKRWTGFTGWVSQKDLCAWPAPWGGEKPWDWESPGRAGPGAGATDPTQAWACVRQGWSYLFVSLTGSGALLVMPSLPDMAITIYTWHWELYSEIKMTQKGSHH